MSDDRVNPVVVDVVRSGWTESRHRATVVVSDPDGSIRVLGDAGAPAYPRSSVKPLQATALGRLGLRLDTRGTALSTASHTGTDEHVALALDILAGAGLDAGALGCPEDLPEERDDLLAYVRAGGVPERVRHNCSGKHVAMLAACAYNGWPVDGYLDPRHLLQKQVVRVIEELAAEAVTELGVDGCGAPAPVISLPGLVRAIRYIATAPSDLPEGRVAQAARTWPDLVGGPTRCSSQLMTACPGLIAKEGAEGVWVAALPDGRTMAAKVDDGAMRALPAILAATVRAWGFDNPVVDRWESDPVLGGGAPVGRMVATGDLTSFLAG